MFISGKWRKAYTLFDKTFDAISFEPRVDQESEYLFGNATLYVKPETAVDGE